MSSSAVLLLTGLGFIVLWRLLYLIKDRFYRLRGVVIERRAVATLRLPSDWEVSPDIAVRGLGNCDLLLVSPEEIRFAIEIKSAESARKVWFGWFTQDEIRKSNGKRFERDPVKQILKVSERLEAKPVLWFPRASKRRTFKTRSGVLVVQGNRRVLERAVGARWGWF